MIKISPKRTQKESSILTNNWYLFLCYSSPSKLTTRTFVVVHTGLIFMFQLLATLDKNKLLCP